MTRAVDASEIELGYGKTVALANSSFAIPTGAVTAVIGPNGSGKSSLLGAIAGLLPVRSGSLEVLGRQVEGIDDRVALVLQSAKVNEHLPVSVAEVVAMGRYPSVGRFRRLGAKDRQTIDEAIALLDLGEVAHHHLAELSGGLRQRVFVAQGLAQEHELLLMDEPLNALDVVSASVIREVIRAQVGQGKTVVVTTHDLAEAGEADHVILLAGRVVATGTPRDVLSSTHLAEAYQAQLVDWDGLTVIDDSAHQQVAARHTHLDRGERTHRH